LIKDRGHAVDVGAHCGLWTRPLAHIFDQVTAFEPVFAHRECFVKNIAEYRLANVQMNDMALGATETAVYLQTDKSSTGDTYIQPGKGEHSARMVAMDSIDLAHIDFLKIDCEGYEYFVLRGGEQTVRRDKPCIIVEQKPNKGSRYGLRDTEAVELLKAWGATLHQVISGDFIFAWSAPATG
jgi:FkbM family methyltransferase